MICFNRLVLWLKRLANVLLLLIAAPVVIVWAMLDGLWREVRWWPSVFRDAVTWDGFK